MKVVLEIPKIETLYHTCHALTHTDMRLKGDKTVNTALNNSIQRESEWTHKASTVVLSEAVHSYAMNKNCLNGEMPTFPNEMWSKEKSNLTHKIKTSVKQKVYSDCVVTQKLHLDTLLKQGDYLTFAM